MFLSFAFTVQLNLWKHPRNTIYIISFFTKQLKCLIQLNVCLNPYLYSLNTKRKWFYIEGVGFLSEETLIWSCHSHTHPTQSCLSSRISYLWRALVAACGCMVRQHSIMNTLLAWYKLTCVLNQQSFVYWYFAIYIHLHTVYTIHYPPWYIITDCTRTPTEREDFL